VIDINDLLFLLGYFGTDGADIDGNGTTDVDDMLILIGNFGPCECPDPCHEACEDYDYCDCEGWIDLIPDPNPCPEGELPDCYGNCVKITWIGDGYCDDGTYSWNGNPIYLNCEQFCFDDGDCPPCDACDLGCGDYDPCNAACGSYDPCNPDCPEYDECACGWGDPCECGWGDPCECGWGDPCECGWGDPCECWGDC
jgi:hypothetical protein